MKRIAVASDLSKRSALALARGTELAQRFDAVLSILHVVDEDLPADARVHEAQDAQAALTAEMASTGVTLTRSAEVVVRSGYPAHAIASFVEEADVDLLVVGAHRRRILADVFVGTTIERVIRAARVPVLLANVQPTAAYRKILAAIDFSEPSVHAVRTASRLGLLKDAHLTLLHAFTAAAKDMMLYAGVEAKLVHQHVGAESLAARRSLNALRAALVLDTGEAGMRLEEGDPEAVVRSAIDELSPDLLVIGTRGATGLDRVLMGSVADALLRSVEIDVLAVPPGVQTC